MKTIWSILLVYGHSTNFLVVVFDVLVANLKRFGNIFETFWCVFRTFWSYFRNFLVSFSNVLVAKKQLLRPKTPEPHPGSGARAGMPKPDPKFPTSHVWCHFVFNFFVAHHCNFANPFWFSRWLIFWKPFDFHRGPIFWKPLCISRGLIFWKPFWFFRGLIWRFLILGAAPLYIFMKRDICDICDISCDIFSCVAIFFGVLRYFLERCDIFSRSAILEFFVTSSVFFLTLNSFCFFCGQY